MARSDSALLDPLAGAPTNPPAGLIFRETWSATSVTARMRAGRFALGSFLLALTILGIAGLVATAVGLVYLLPALALSAFFAARVVLGQWPRRLRIGSRVVITGMPLGSPPESVPLDDVGGFRVESQTWPASMNPVPLGGPFLTWQLGLVLCNGTTRSVRVPTEDRAQLAFIAARLNALVQEVRARILTEELRAAGAADAHRGLARGRVAGPEAIDDSDLPGERNGASKRSS